MFRRLHLLLNPLFMSHIDKDQSEALEDGEKEEEEELLVLVAQQGQQPLLLACMRLRPFELDHEPLQLTVVISFLKGKQIITVVGLCNSMTS